MVEHSHLQFKCNHCSCLLFFAHQTRPWAFHPGLTSDTSAKEWQVGGVHHLTPQTHLPSFSSLASSPVPFGFWLDSANGWHQTEAWGAREAWGRHIYSPTVSLQAHSRSTVSPYERTQLMPDSPSFPFNQNKNSSPPLLSPFAAPTWLCSLHLPIPSKGSLY